MLAFPYAMRETASMTCHIIASPIGAISISASADALQSIDMVGQMAPSGRTDHPLLQEAERQLHAYFAHDIKEFDYFSFANCGRNRKVTLLPILGRSSLTISQSSAPFS